MPSTGCSHNLFVIVKWFWHSLSVWRQLGLTAVNEPNKMFTWSAKICSGAGCFGTMTQGNLIWTMYVMWLLGVMSNVMNPTDKSSIDARCELWFSWYQLHTILSHQQSCLPDRTTWKPLNRLRTQVGLCGDNQAKKTNIGLALNQ